MASQNVVQSMHPSASPHRNVEASKEGLVQCGQWRTLLKHGQQQLLGQHRHALSHLVDGEHRAFQQLLEVFVFRAQEPVERRFGACNGLPRRIAILVKDVRLGVELAFGSALLPEHTAI